MKGCRGIQSLLGPYLYGELPPRERRRVERHLGGCESCREELEGCRQVKERIPADLFQASAPARAHLLARVAAAQRQAARRPAPRRRALVLAVVLLGAVAVLAVMWAGGNRLFTGHPEGPALVGAPGAGMTATGAAPAGAPALTPLPPAAPPGSGNSLAEGRRPRGLEWVPVGIRSLKNYWRALTAPEDNELTGEPPE